MSGALLSTAFEPVGLWWTAPLAIAAHMYGLSRSTHKIWSTLIFAFVFNALLLHWTSTFVGSTPWLILTLGLSLLYVPLALVNRWGMSAYPLLFIALEEVRNRFPFGGFGWARVAYSQADSPYSPIAARGGAIALSAITVLLGAFIFFVVQKNLQVILLLPLFALLIPNNIVVIGDSSALLVQGNVPELGLDFNSRAQQVFKNHVQQTQKALGTSNDIDFIVWPENAVDVDPYTNKDVYQTLDAFEHPIIVGAIVGKGEKLLNTSIFWSDNGQEVYLKQHLTPFGEYIPLRSLAQKISPLVNRVDDFSPGDQQKSFTIGSAKVAPIICYELIDDQILHKAAINSNLLVVQTNSATFGMSAESAQQLSITRVRAIEHSRNVLSVSTTGYSAVIDFNGQILQKTSMATADHIFATIGLIDQKSVRDKAGDWASVFTLIWLLIVARKEIDHRR